MGQEEKLADEKTVLSKERGLCVKDCPHPRLVYFNAFVGRLDVAWVWLLILLDVVTAVIASQPLHYQNQVAKGWKANAKWIPPITTPE